MSLNTLARSAFAAAALASAVPNAGCDKTHQAVPEEQEFPECGEGMKAIETESGHYVSGPVGSNEENCDCVYDRLYARDCRAIREEGRARIKRIPSLFKCENGQVKLAVRPSWIADLTNFSDSTAETKGDCDRTRAEYSDRIMRVMNRLSCDKDGKPHEELGGGKAEGGRFYNPCADGRC